jgi:LAO/AO transport system kinase
VLKTCALHGEGIEELVAAVQAHWQYQCDSGLGEQRERERVADELRRVLRYTLLERLLNQVSERALQETVERIVRREEDPYSAAAALIAEARLSC